MLYDKRNKNFNDEFDCYDDVSEDESIYDNEDIDLDEKDNEEGYSNDEITEDIEEEIKKVESSTSNKTYDFTEIIRLYHSDNEKDQEKAKEQAISSLTGIIHLIIRQHYITYRKNYYYDLLSEGNLGILKGLKVYDPERSKPSTFFYPYIMHEMQSFIDANVNKTTAHYSSNIRKINKVINELKEKEIPFDEVTIASMTNLTMETVRQAMAIRNCKDEVNYDGHTEAFINGNSRNTPVQNPEDEYIEQEKNEAVYNAIDENLTEYEKAIVEYSFGVNNTAIISHKEISKRLGIPIDKVKKYYSSALRKLRNSSLKTVFNDYLEEDEGFTLESEVPLLPIQVAINDSQMLAAVDIDF